MFYFWLILFISISVAVLVLFCLIYEREIKRRGAGPESLELESDKDNLYQKVEEYDIEILE